MSMTKKDFERAALVVRTFREKHSEGGTFKDKDVVEEVALQLEISFVDLFSSGPHRFDSYRFRQSCRVV